MNLSRYRMGTVGTRDEEAVEGEEEEEGWKRIGTRWI